MDGSISGVRGKVGFGKMYDFRHSQELRRTDAIKMDDMRVNSQDSCIWKGKSCMLHADLKSSRQAGR